MLIDSHAHLDFATEDSASLEACLERAWQAGVEKILHIGSAEKLDSFRNALSVCEKSEKIFTSLAVHPHDAKLVSQEVLNEIESLASHPKVLAIGEVGLDFYYEHSDREVQEQVFRQFIQLARKLNKPLIIHSRDAAEETIRILEEEKASEVGGVIHCFTYDYDFAAQVLPMNFYISFSGIVTFKNAKEIQDAAQRLPLDRILVETDSPFLAPVPYRGKKNEPSYVIEVAKKISELREESLDLIIEKTGENAQKLFGFK